MKTGSTHSRQFDGGDEGQHWRDAVQSQVTSHSPSSEPACSRSGKGQRVFPEKNVAPSGSTVGGTGVDGTDSSCARTTIGKSTARE